MIISSGLLLAALLPLLAYAEPFFDCRPPGPIVPRPTNIASNADFLAATSKLTSILKTAMSGEIEPGWSVENTSFAMGFISHDKEKKGVAVWEFHFLAPNNQR